MPALGGRQPYSISLLDYSAELKSIPGLFTGEITAITIAGLLTQLGTFKTALNAVVLGVIARERWGEETILSNTKATEKDAQVESELLVLCQGATSEAPHSFRIPTIDYTAFNYADPPAGDSVIISGAGASAATTALISAIEATFKMPNDETEALNVVGMKVVR